MITVPIACNNNPGVLIPYKAASDIQYLTVFAALVSTAFRMYLDTLDNDEEHALAYHALDPGGDHTHTKFQYADPTCNLFLKHSIARTQNELMFLTHHFSVYTNMKWLQEGISDSRGVAREDLRLSVLLGGGLASMVTVALVVKKDKKPKMGSESWDVFFGGSRTSEAEAWKAFVDAVRREGVRAARVLLR